MAAFELKLDGIDKLLAKLESLPVKVEKKILRTALREGAKVVAAAAKQNAPFKSGQIKKAIKVRALKRQRRGTVGVSVQVGEGDFKGDQYYAAFVEYGHRIGSRKLGASRKQVPAHPFMRPAFDENKQRAAEVIERTVAAGLDQVARQ